MARAPGLAEACWDHGAALYEQGLHEEALKAYGVGLVVYLAAAELFRATKIQHIIKEIGA